MSLGDDIAAALPELRAHAESRMCETVTVRRPAGWEPDPVTGNDVPTYADPDPYVGQARLKPPSTVKALEPDLAGSAIVTQPAELHIPWEGPALLPGDVVLFAADTYTPRLRGLVYRVVSSHAASDVTAQRVPVEILPGVAS